MLFVIAMLMAEATQTNCHDTFYGQPQLGQTCETVTQSTSKYACAGKNFLLAGCSFTRHQKDKEHKALIDSVTAKIKAGDCKGGIDAALDAGDIETAKAAKEYCDLRQY